MYEVNQVRYRNELVETYREAFKARFENYPILDNDVIFPILDWAIETLTYQKTKDLIKAYLRMNDDWLAEQAFPLEFFKKQINKVIASSSKNIIKQGDLYFVGKTISGVPIYSLDPKTLKSTIARDWEVMLWEEYLSQQQEMN